MIFACFNIVRVFVFRGIVKEFTYRFMNVLSYTYMCLGMVFCNWCQVLKSFI